VEVSGKSVGDEDAVESGLAAGVEINLLEGGEAVVVDGEVDGKVGWRREGIVSVGHCMQPGVIIRKRQNSTNT